MRLLPAAFFLLLPVCFNAFALNDEPASDEKLKISGAVEFDVAQYVKMRNYQGMTSAPGASVTLKNIWFGHNIGKLNFESVPLPFLRVKAGFEFNQYMTTRPTIGGASPNAQFGQSYWNAFYIREGQGIFSIIDNESVLFDCALGYFPYKYNPEVRNLGEFLFRSGTYPLYLLGEFDRPFARLTGLRTGFEYKNDLFSSKIDVMGLLERTVNPFNTISVASVANINLLKIFEIGYGINFAHLIHMDKRFTKVKQLDNAFVTDSIGTVVWDSSQTPPETLYVIWENVYDYYDFKGTKMAWRATIDPLAMLRGKESVISDILGEEGLKFYGEYAIIGTKNYPAAYQSPIFPTYKRNGYTKRKERSPWMVGFTIPAWKILDVFAVEFERFPSYYADDYYTPSCHGFPLPAQLQGEAYDSTTFVPRWNWSVYLNKRFSKNVAVIGQAARDHQRAERHPGAMQFNDYGAATVKWDEWSWHLCLQFNF